MFCSFIFTACHDCSALQSSVQSHLWTSLWAAEDVIQPTTTQRRQQTCCVHVHDIKLILRWIKKGKSLPHLVTSFIMRASLINDQWLGSLLALSPPPPCNSPSFSRLLHPVSSYACCYNCFHVPQLWYGPCWWGGEPRFWRRTTESSWVGSFAGLLRGPPSAQLRVVLCADDTGLWVRLSFARTVQFPLQSCHGNLLQPIRVTARLALQEREANVPKRPLEKSFRRLLMDGHADLWHVHILGSNFTEPGSSSLQTAFTCDETGGRLLPGDRWPLRKTKREASEGDWELSCS